MLAMMRAILMNGKVRVLISSPSGRSTLASSSEPAYTDAMVRLFSAVITLCAAVGCGGGPNVPDMPPLSIGGGGVALMTDAKTPREAYELAYSRLRNFHAKLESCLTGTSTNELGAHRN